MKKSLRKWLGIIEPKELDIDREIVKAVVEALEMLLKDVPTRPPLSYVDYGIRFSELRAGLTRHIQTAAKIDAEDVTKATVARIVNPEEFIDTVVERIQRKQL